MEDPDCIQITICSLRGQFSIVEIEQSLHLVIERQQINQIFLPDDKFYLRISSLISCRLAAY